MRKNCQQAVKAFDNSRAARPAESIWTDGETIWSYSTAIMTVAPGGSHSHGPWILNRTSYSVTTTIHQNALAAEYPGNSTTEVDNLRQGCSREDLIEAARDTLEV